MPAENKELESVFAKIDSIVDRHHQKIVDALSSSAPSSAPSEPSSAPSEPSSAPSEPSSAPSEPSSAPSEPSSAPSEPSSVPSEPSSVPSEPSSAPSEPSVPSSAPSEPSSTSHRASALGGSDELKPWWKRLRSPIAPTNKPRLKDASGKNLPNWGDTWRWEGLKGALKRGWNGIDPKGKAYNRPTLEQYLNMKRFVSENVDKAFKDTLLLESADPLGKVFEDMKEELKTEIGKFLVNHAKAFTQQNLDHAKALEKQKGTHAKEIEKQQGIHAKEIEIHIKTLKTLQKEKKSLEERIKLHVKRLKGLRLRKQLAQTQKQKVSTEENIEKVKSELNSLKGRVEQTNDKQEKEIKTIERLADHVTPENKEIVIDKVKEVLKTNDENAANAVDTIIDTDVLGNSYDNVPALQSGKNGTQESETPKRKPGRPRKNPVVDTTTEPAETSADTPKRKPGRPRTKPVVDTTTEPDTTETPKRKPGRPKKNPIVDATTKPPEEKKTEIPEDKPKAKPPEEKKIEPPEEKKAEIPEDKPKAETPEEKKAREKKEDDDYRKSQFDTFS